ncbi:MAG: hypothetical protein ACOC2L_01260 [Candidatus Sumerlaeota bacterium]
MLITRDFVMLNYPKTGSSFTRKALKKIHRHRDKGMRNLLIHLGLSKPSLQEFLLPILDRHNPEGKISQHGTYRQIPEVHRGKPVVSVIRNPLSRMVSAWRFGWWLDNPPAPAEQIQEQYPNFPNLGFREFYEMQEDIGLRNRLGKIQLPSPIGINTVHFIQFFFPDPASILCKIDADYHAEDLKKEMPDITFLHQENLNEEFGRYLRQMGYREDEIAQIDKLGKVNVTDDGQDKKHFLDYYDDDMLQNALRKERLLFGLFPEYAPERRSTD